MNGDTNTSGLVRSLWGIRDGATLTRLGEARPHLRRPPDQPSGPHELPVSEYSTVPMVQSLLGWIPTYRTEVHRYERPLVCVRVL